VHIFGKNYDGVDVAGLQAVTPLVGVELLADAGDVLRVVKIQPDFPPAAGRESGNLRVDPKLLGDPRGT
jgi:hypothetical protein